MRIICLLVCYFGSAIFCFPQSENSKILKNLVNALSSQKEDTLKVLSYETICKNYLNEDFTEVNYYNNKLLKLSVALKYKKGYGLYYYYLAKTYRKTQDLSKSIFYAKKALKTFHEIKDWDNYFISSALLANYIQNIGKVEWAKTFLLNNINLAKKKRKFNSVGILYYGLSVTCLEWNMLKECLIYSNLAIKHPCNDEIKNKIYMNIADVNIAFNDFEEATKYNNLAILNAYITTNENYIYIQKTKILIEQKKYNEALLIILNRKKLDTKLTRDEKNWNIFYLSKCYFYLKKYEIAMQTIETLLKEASLSDSTYFKVLMLTYQSNIYLALNNKLLARENIDKAINLFDSKLHFELELSLYTTKYMVEQTLENYQEAFKYRNKAAEFENKNNLRINQEKLSYLQTNFEINDKNNKIKKLESAQFIKAIELKKQKDLITFIGILLLIALSFVFFYVKTNKTIKKKNKLIENEKLLTQKSLQEKEILLKEIHHRVKNNMQTVISLLKIQSLDEKESTIADFVSVSESRINSMILIHENLYLNETLDRICFEEYLDNLKHSIIVSQKSSNNIKLDVIVKKVCLNIQTAIPIGLIINELVTNAYKHAFSNQDNGQILIQLVQIDKEFQLTICDNGSGISSCQLKKNSLGLELVRLLVSQIKGVIEMDNSTGTSYTIRFKSVIV